MISVQALGAFTFTGQLVQIELHVIKFVLIGILAAPMVLTLTPETCSLLVDIVRSTVILLQSLHWRGRQTCPRILPEEARFCGPAHALLLTRLLHAEHVAHRVDLSYAFFGPRNRLLDLLLMLLGLI